MGYTHSFIKCVSLLQHIKTFFGSSIDDQLMQAFQRSNITTFTCALNPQYVLDMERSHDSPQRSVKLLLYTLNGGLFMVATFLNLLIVLGFLTMPRRLTPTYILLCNLALTDFVIGLAMAPISTMTLALSEFEQICSSFKAYFYLGVFLGSSSLYTLTCISCDRYLSIKMQKKYRTAVTNKKAYKTIALIWLVSLVGPMFMSFLNKWAVSLLICCLQALCLIIIVDCYALSFGVIKRRRREIKSTIHHPLKVLSKIKPGEENTSVAAAEISCPSNHISSKSFSINSDQMNMDNRIKTHIKVSSSEEEERCSFVSLEGPIESPKISLDSNEKDTNNESTNTTIEGNSSSSSEKGSYSFGSLKITSKSLNENENKKINSKESTKSFNEEEIPGFGNLVSSNESSRTFTSSDESGIKIKVIKMDAQCSINDSEIDALVSIDLNSKPAESVYNQEGEGQSESVCKDQDFLLKLKTKSILRETEKSTENENKLKVIARKQKSNETARRGITFSKHKSRTLKATKEMQRRRPSSLLADVEIFRKSLNTILIIVLALFICYLPFLVVNILATLRVIQVVDGWYDLAIVIVFFHSCVSPITLCVRIPSIRKACWSVLKRMCSCNSVQR